MFINAEELLYWASMDSTEAAVVEMSSLNGSGRVTLLNESAADYTGITLYNDTLYISDKSRRSVIYTVSAKTITKTWKIGHMEDWRKPENSLGYTGHCRLQI